MVRVERKRERVKCKSSIEQFLTVASDDDLSILSYHMPTPDGTETYCSGPG